MDIEKIIEFDKIKEMWMKLAVTEEAKEKSGTHPAAWRRQNCGK